MVAVQVASVDVSSLYRASADRVELVRVPELRFVAVVGAGAPESTAFADAVHALYAVSYAVHAALKQRDGWAPRVMPLEAQWWVDDASMWRSADRSTWRWRAMILQPEPVGGEIVGEAIAATRKRRASPAADRVREVVWEEGPSAQILHVGPYADEPATVVRLHQELAAQGYHPRGRHHEIYLGDPRRAAPDRLRTILRQPVARS